MKSFKNLQEFIDNPIRFLDKSFESGHTKRLEQIRIGHKKFVLVFDPELAREVLVLKSAQFAQNKAIFNRITPITGETGLVQLTGIESSNMRRKFAVMFAPSNMSRMKVVIEEKSQRHFSEVQTGICDIKEVLFSLVLKNAFQVFLGLDIDEENADVADHFQKLNYLCGKRMLSAASLPLFFPTPSNLYIKNVRSHLIAKIQNALSKRSPSNLDIPELFLDDPTLIDQCLTFLFAGHETTASSLTFAIYLLAKNPDYQHRIATGDDKLALQTYKEALRLYPPAYMLARESSQNCVIGGYEVIKGAQVLIGIKQIHYHPGFHDSPHSFFPERFENRVTAFLPFGLGNKSCIGESLAYAEAITIIKIFCRMFIFSSLNEDIKATPHITLHPEGHVPLMLRRRNG